MFKKNKTPSRRNSEEEEVEQHSSSSNLKTKKKTPSRKNSDDEEEHKTTTKKKTPSRKNSEEDDIDCRDPPSLPPPKPKKKHGKKNSDDDEDESSTDTHDPPPSSHNKKHPSKRPLSHHSTPQLSHINHPPTPSSPPHNDDEDHHSEHHLRHLSFHSIKGSFLNLFHHSSSSPHDKDHSHHSSPSSSSDHHHHKDHHKDHHHSSSSSSHSSHHKDDKKADHHHHSSSSSSSASLHSSTPISHSNPTSPTAADLQQHHTNIHNSSNNNSNNNSNSSSSNNLHSNSNNHININDPQKKKNERVEQIGKGEMKSSSSAGNLHHQIHKKPDPSPSSSSSKTSLKSSSAQDLSHLIDHSNIINNNNKSNINNKNNISNNNNNNNNKSNHNKSSSGSSNSSSSDSNEGGEDHHHSNIVIMEMKKGEESEEEEEEMECNHSDHHHHHQEIIDEEEIIKKKEIAIDCPSNGLEAFERVRLIGRGDVGKVYLVKHKLSGKPYAMKVMSKEEMVARRKIHRALTEREILISSNFPLLVTMHYSFQNDRNLYFVMDYCAGGEFFRALQRQPNHCLSEAAAKFYAAEVAMALEYLHMKGIVYRDLKPENILLQSTGHIMLTDFNLSKQSTTPVVPKVINSMFQSADKAKVELKPHLFATSLVGTEEYLAPEVVKGCAHNASLDWWTFGVLLYEMIFGVTPFKGRNREETFALIKKGNGIKFPKAPPVSMECKNLIQKLLTVNPQKRLGADHGASDIKAHPFFRDIKWPLILNESPPIIPVLADPFDTSNFRDIEEEIEDCSTVDLRTKLADPFRDLKDMEKADHSSGVRKKDDKK